MSLIFEFILKNHTALNLNFNVSGVTHCGGYISKMMFISGSSGQHTYIKIPDLPHYLWTSNPAARNPLILAFFRQAYVQINSENCFKENYSFRRATFTKYF